MNRDDVIRMAREAGAWVADDQHSLLHFLERFAALIAAHVRETEFKPDWNKYQQGLADGAAAAVEREREACAKLCEVRAEEEAGMVYEVIALDCAAAIRARGNTTSRGQT